MTKTTLFKITTLSNLHVGAGEQNFGIIDNLVQRDPITELPVMHSSSLKGAILHHFESFNPPYSVKKMRPIFGYEDKEKKETRAGEVKFLQAELLALPARSNRQLYFLATTPQILNDFIESYTLMTKKKIDLEIPNSIDVDIAISTNDTNCWIEDYEVNKTNDELVKKISEKLFNGKPLALMREDIFKSISLPIITRNKIAKTEEDDNNLFYEEVIPRRSIFYSYVITPDDIDRGDPELEKVFEEFIVKMQEENIQIGANASIGYGLCQFKKVSYE